MGDRCWLQIKIWRKHVDKFFEVTGEERKYLHEVMDEHGNMIFEIEEANYGWYEPLETAASAGIVFAGQHGSGGSYGPNVFACDGEEYGNVAADWDLCVPVAQVQDDGTVHPGDLREAQIYLGAYKRAREIMDNDGGTELRRIVDEEDRAHET